MILREIEARVTVSVPAPNIQPACDLLGVSTPDSVWYEVRSFEYHRLPVAVCAWLDGGRQRCSIECVVKVLERRCTSVYNGTSWGEWR